MNQQEQEQRATNAAPPFSGPSSLLEQLHEPGLGQGEGEGRGYYGALPQLDGLGTMPQLDGTLQAINGGMYAPTPQLQPGRAAHATQQFEGSTTQTHAANDVQMFGSQPGGLGFLQEGFAFQPRMLGQIPSPYSGMMGTPGSTHGPGTPATPMTSRSMSPEINRSAALKTSGMDAAAHANGPQTGMSTPSQRAHPPGLMQRPQSQVLPNAAPSSPETARSSTETARSSPETARSSPEMARSSPEAMRSSPETSRSASIAPPQIPIADQINTLLEDAANNAPLLSKNASLMKALLNFRMEYTPAVLGTLLSSIDEQIKRQVVSDTRQMIQSDTTSRNFEAVYARIAQLEAALADSNGGNGSGSGSSSGRKKAETVKSNDHGELKNLIHDLLWKLCGVKSSKDTKEGDKFEQLLDTPSDRVGMVEENGLTTWYPEWQARVDTRVNMEFLEYLVQQVFENDERMHKAGGLRRIPEKSRSLSVAAAIAKAFFQYVAGGLQLRRTVLTTGLSSGALGVNMKHVGMEHGKMQRGVEAREAWVYENPASGARTPFLGRVRRRGRLFGAREWSTYVIFLELGKGRKSLAIRARKGCKRSKTSSSITPFSLDLESSRKYHLQIRKGVPQ